MIRFGLCCKFHRAPIRFYQTTATAMLKRKRAEALDKIGDLCLANADSLMQALKYCRDHDIGGFRVNSRILPLKTHPEAGWDMEDLKHADGIVSGFKACGRFAKKNNIRTTFHPDQFVLLSSPNPEINDRSIEELEYQALVARWIGADVINIHGGGGYGDKAAAIERLRRNVNRLSRAVRQRLTLENDERVYTPLELVDVCRKENIPLVYDVHHHRCLPDGLTIGEATDLTVSTWDREPLFHVSSPRGGWSGGKPSLHHDYIDPADFPSCWREMNITVEVEAKAKEVAIEKLKQDLGAQTGGQACEDSASGNTPRTSGSKTRRSGR